MIEARIPENLITRDSLEEIVRVMPNSEAIVLMGSRQAGKTSLLYLLINHLRHKKTQEKQLFYFDLENIKQADLLNSFSDFDAFPQFLKTQGADLSKHTYIFIDEIQYMNEPSRFLKYLVDHYRPELKFIVSGSSTLAIKRKFSDSMVGRIIPFEIHPLNFEEFLLFSGKKILYNNKREFTISNLIIKKGAHPDTKIYDTLSLQKEFESFCTTGGYPQTSLAYSSKEKEEILSRLYSLYIRKDLRELENIPDTAAFNKLVSLLSFQIGNLIQATELAAHTQVSRQTVNRYLFILENTFILHLCKPYFTNPRTEHIKLPKVYFEDAGLRNFIAGNLRNMENRPDSGSLVENQIFMELKKQERISGEVKFWRSESGTEVDFVISSNSGKIYPLEIKYQPFKKSKIPSGLRAFIERYKPEMAFVATKNFWGKEKLNSTKIIFLPAWAV